LITDLKNSISQYNIPQLFRSNLNIYSYMNITTHSEILICKASNTCLRQLIPRQNSNRKIIFPATLVACIIHYLVRIMTIQKTWVTIRDPFTSSSYLIRHPSFSLSSRRCPRVKSAKSRRERSEWLRSVIYLVRYERRQRETARTSWRIGWDLQDIRESITVDFLRSCWNHNNTRAMS